VFALSSITVIAWTSFAIRGVDRSQDALDEIDYWTWDPDPFIDDHLDRERDFLSVVRIIGFIGLMFGVILTLYGYSMRERAVCTDSFVAAGPAVNDGTVRYCEFCGQTLALGSVWCKGCGRKRPDSP
jgi:hypothetical protein